MEKAAAVGGRQPLHLAVYRGLGVRGINAVDYGAGARPCPKLAHYYRRQNRAIPNPQKFPDSIFICATRR